MKQQRASAALLSRLHERVADLEIDRRLEDQGVLFTAWPGLQYGPIAWNLSMEGSRYRTRYVVIEECTTGAPGCGPDPDRTVDVRRLVCNLTTDTVYSRREQFSLPRNMGGRIELSNGVGYTALHALSSFADVLAHIDSGSASAHVDSIIEQGASWPPQASGRPIGLESPLLLARVDALLLTATQLASQ
jgi:hypothetical protein